MNKKLFTLAAVATMLAACSSNDEIVTQEDNLKDTPTTILSAGVADLTTRAITDNGTNLTLDGTNASLGLYVENDNENYAATHERYNYSSGWVFSANEKDDTQMLWSGSSFNYIAYSPYSIKVGETETYLCNMGTTFSVPTDGKYEGGWTDADTYYQLTTVSGSQYDLLWGTASSSSNEITPTLNHVLTMLVVNITGFGSEINTDDGDPTIESVSIGGTVVTGDLKLTDATTSSEVITAKNENATPITAMEMTKADNMLATYEALIIPQQATLTISVTLNNGSTYSSTLTNAKTFQSGYKYTINLQVGQDEVVPGSISAAAWGTPEDGGSLETE